MNELNHSMLGSKLRDSFYVFIKIGLWLFLRNCPNLCSERSCKQQRALPSTFFFSWKSKVAVDAIFGLFSTIFTDEKVDFTLAFVQLFIGSKKFSRKVDRIEDFSRVALLFTGKKIYNQEQIHGRFFSHG